MTPPPVPRIPSPSATQNLVPTLLSWKIDMGETTYLTQDDLEAAVAHGARFMRFPYCFSVIVLSFQRALVHYLPPGFRRAGVPGWPR